VTQTQTIDKRSPEKLRGRGRRSCNFSTKLTTNEAQALEEAASRAGKTPSEWARDLLLHGVVAGSRKLPSRVAYGCSRAPVTHSHIGTTYFKYCAIVNTSKICHGLKLPSNGSISMTSCDIDVRVGGAGPKNGSGSSRFVRSPAVVSREIDGETIVVPICRGVADMDSLFIFNASGSAIWGLLKQNRQESEILAWLADSFDTSETGSAEDLHVFLCELLEAGLITSV
jgi:hypothetical protein